MSDIPFGIKSKDDYNAFLIELGKVLKYPCGKRVLLTILSSCNIYEVSNNFSNQMESFKSGQRNIGLQILSAIMDLDGGKSYSSMLSDYWRTYHGDNIMEG
jgi:hypothetical protein